MLLSHLIDIKINYLQYQYKHISFIFYPFIKKKIKKIFFIFLKLNKNL